MKFYLTNIKNFEQTQDKIERYFAFKYEVKKQDISVILQGKALFIMVDGKLKEKITAKQLLICGIHEETLTIIK